MPNAKLRGNTFIVLLLRASVNELSERPGWGKNNNSITRPVMFSDLIRLIKPDYKPSKQDSLSSYFSKYLQGQMPYSKTYFPFDTFEFQQGLQNRINEDYPSVLLDMNKFCDKYLQKSDLALKNLVGGLVEAILEDDSFDGYFDIGGRWVKKVELPEISEFTLQPFLVSIWNTIVSRYPDASEGAETYREWTKHESANTPDIITTHIGKETALKIRVKTDLPELKQSNVEGKKPDFGEKKGPTDKAEPEIIEAEVVEGITSPFETKTVNKEGRVYHQQATTIYNIENIENFNG